jgi:metal-responsive CopG/Arc/MetJ family transcriptional regulator
VESIVDDNPHMQTIQVVLEEGLLKAADRAVKHSRTNRSALIRDALREHLRRLHARELEDRDRRGYQKLHADSGVVWERQAAWPDD